MAITGTLGTITILSLPFGGDVVTVSANDPYAVGGVEPVYAITICDAYGTPLLKPRDWEAVEYSLVENAFGRFRLELPGYYSRDYLKPDNLVVIERGLGNAAPALVAGRSVYRLRRRRRRQISGSPFFTWELYGPDIAEILARRHVDYPAGSSYARKSGAADDLLKAIVRENFGALTSDSTRSIAASLAVQADLSAGPTVAKTFPWRNVLKVQQEIAAASLEAGTYLAFDVVPTWAPGTGAFAAEFRTYTGQRGIDHRFPAGSPPVLIGPDFGNLDGVEIDEDWEDEATRVIAGGQGQAESRAVERADDATRQGLSPWGLIEYFEDARNSSTAALLDEAEALLRMMRPRKIASGRIRTTAGLLLGVHYNWGDFVTFQEAGDIFDAHLAALVVSKRRDAAEDIDVVLRTEE